MYISNNVKQFIKFGITGGMGTVINLVLFFLFADKAGLPEIPVSTGCFLIAGTQNYIINHFWSFSIVTASAAPSLKKWLLYIGVSLMGLAFNILVLKAVLAYWKPPYKVIAQGAGIAAGMIINFLLSKTVVFKHKVST
jgi:putative flippase GtrA